ncbi:unnamed protein product [Brachionus calyciflorus]|uniref:Uncharacterized protein n=1 Tax=Brachionus calyciflorus TaxID=104777 RepID=A0A813QKB6_9BILA|nr:unnamed protein product [Brachionus calyciflorus]
MNSVLASGLCFLIFVVNCVYSNDQLLKDEIVALNRDGFARQNPDDDFTGGKLAAWPVTLFLIAAACFVISIVSFFAYAVGICRKPKHHFQTINA